tara:strand:- start:96 stop:857 length:762 start_codon:yes stop_codon:yes gene_type:complete
MVYSPEFNAVSGSEAQKRAQQDFDDLQNEVAGRDVGRIERFLNGESNHPNSEKARRKEREAEMTRFMALMSDPVYAKLYEDWGKKLNETRQFLDEAREQLAKFRASIEAERLDIDARAARLPDGTLVYRGDDDRAYNRDGTLSENPDAQHIQWRESHARLSENLRNDDRAGSADRLEQKLDHADIAVGESAERHQDTGNPKTSPDGIKDELEGLDDIVDDISGEISGLKNETSREATAEIKAVTPPLSLPELK